MHDETPHDLYVGNVVFHAVSVDRRTVCERVEVQDVLQSEDRSVRTARSRLTPSGHNPGQEKPYHKSKPTVKINPESYRDIEINSFEVDAPIHQLPPSSRRVVFGKFA